MKTYQYYAGGAWHDPASGQWIDSENPAIGEVWASPASAASAGVGA